MQVLIKDISEFGSINLIGVHKMVDGLRSVEDAIAVAKRDQFPRIIFYIRHWYGCEFDTDFQRLVKTLQECVNDPDILYYNDDVFN